MALIHEGVGIVVRDATGTFERGESVVMLTGDNAKTAEAIRRQVGVDRVVAEVFPQDKEKEIRRLQSAGLFY